MDPNLSTTTRLTRDQLLDMEMNILLTIDHTFPQYTPHMFICYFLRFLRLFIILISLTLKMYLDDEIEIFTERLHNASMVLLVHIYLQWTSLIETLAKKESGSTTEMYWKIFSLNNPLNL